MRDYFVMARSQGGGMCIRQLLNLSQCWIGLLNVLPGESFPHSTFSLHDILYMQ